MRGIRISGFWFMGSWYVVGKRKGFISCLVIEFWKDIYGRNFPTEIQQTTSEKYILSDEGAYIKHFYIVTLMCLFRI